MTWPNRKRVGLIEIGSYAVRRMVATFELNGNFSLDGSESREYVHGIDIENIEEPKVAALWSAVQQFYRSLVDSAFPLADIWVYGTELCRRLSKGPYRLPSYVMVLSADREAMMSWATGFVKTKDYGIDGWTYTIFDQGGGSAELVSGTWNSKRNMIDYLVYETFDLGHSKLAKLYSTSSPISCVTEIRGLLERHAEKIAPQEVKERRSMLILLGGPATKLAFNIKHKKDVNHDYNARAVDVTAISVKEMQSYYNKIVEIHKTDQRRARYEIDRRMVDTDEYERVMSGAILLMLISTRLGYPKVTVTASSTRYGFGFLAARGIIQNKEGMG